MVVAIILLVLGAIALTLFLLEKCHRYSVKETIIKSIASLIFIALAAYSFYHSGLHVLGVFVIIGLVFGLLGDIWLDFKYVFPEQDRTFTYAGFIVFGIGHIFYITGMFLEFYKGNNPLFIICPFIFGILGTLVVLGLEKPLKLKYANYKWIVALYSFILMSMFGTTVSLAINNSFAIASLNMLVGGGILFVASDLVLSGTYFGEGKERPIDITINAIMYYVAQYTIAFSLFFL